MAIAFDAASHSYVNPGTSLTVAHTVGAGANRALVVTIIADSAVDVVTGVTYGGAALTLIRKGQPGIGRWTYGFYLSAPVSGTANIIVSASSSVFLEIDAASYSGVSQAGQPEVSSAISGSSSATAQALSITTLTANAWVVGCVLGQAGSVTAGASTALRATALVGALIDSGAAIATPSSATLNFNQPSAGQMGGTLMSLAPSGSGSITINEPTDYTVIQRSGTVGSLSVSGTYTGTPVNVQVRVVQFGTSTQVVAWTNTTASAGTWNAVLTGIPQGGWYQLQAQFSNDVTTNSSGTHHWGVGCLIGIIGQSELVHADTDGTAVTPNALLAQYTGSSGTGWSLRTSTGNGLNTIGNALIVALGGTIPVALLKYAVGSTALDAAANAGSGYWLDTSAGQLYANFKAGVVSVGGKLEACVWDQGQQDGYSAAVSQATYNSDLQTFFSRIRTDFGQASLPIVVVPLGNYSAAVSPITDASWEGVRQAQIAVGQLANNTLSSSNQDLALLDGVHYATAAFITYGNRVGQALNAALGLSANPRGPAIVSAVQAGSTTLIINLSQRAGSDFTPVSGITGFTVNSGAGVATINSAVRTSATKITLTTAAAMTGAITVQYQYGRTPTVTSPILDNSANTLPAVIESGGTLTAIILATIAAGVLTTDGTTPASSLSGLRWAFFGQATPDIMVAPTAKGVGAVTDSGGNFSLSITGTALATNSVGFLIINQTDGTVTTNFKGYAGPLRVI